MTSLLPPLPGSGEAKEGADGVSPSGVHTLVGGPFFVDFGEGPLGMTLEAADGTGAAAAGVGGGEDAAGAGGGGGGGAGAGAGAGAGVGVETVAPGSAASVLGVRPGDVLVSVGDTADVRGVAGAIAAIKGSARPVRIAFDRRVRSVLMFYDFIPQSADDHRVESMADLLVRVNKATLRNNWDVLNLETVLLKDPSNPVCPRTNGNSLLQIVRVWYRVAPALQGMRAGRFMEQPYSRETGASDPAIA